MDSNEPDVPLPPFTAETANHKCSELRFRIADNRLCLSQKQGGVK